MGETTRILSHSDEGHVAWEMLPRRWLCLFTSRPPHRAGIESFLVSEKTNQETNLETWGSHLGNPSLSALEPASDFGFHRPLTLASHF